MKTLRYLSLLALVYIGACAYGAVAGNSLEGTVEDSARAKMDDVHRREFCDFLRDMDYEKYLNSDECR